MLRIFIIQRIKTFITDDAEKKDPSERVEMQLFKFFLRKKWDGIHICDESFLQGAFFKFPHIKLQQLFHNSQFQSLGLTDKEIFPRVLMLIGVVSDKVLLIFQRVFIPSLLVYTSYNRTRWKVDQPWEVRGHELAQFLSKVCGSGVGRHLQSIRF